MAGNVVFGATPFPSEEKVRIGPGVKPGKVRAGAGVVSDESIYSVLPSRCILRHVGLRPRPRCFTSATPSS